MQVLDTQLINGATLTRSLVNTVANPLTFTGTLQLGAADLADPNLSFEITMQRAIEPGRWEPFGVAWWTGGPGVNAPKITAQGLARRVRLLIDPSRHVSVGADISQAGG